MQWDINHPKYLYSKYIIFLTCPVSRNTMLPSRLNLTLSSQLKVDWEWIDRCRWKSWIGCFLKKKKVRLVRIWKQEGQVVKWVGKPDKWSPDFGKTSFRLWAALVDWTESRVGSESGWTKCWKLATSMLSSLTWLDKWTKCWELTTSMLV